MAVIQYKCDVCEREIDIPQNKRGLEVMQRCIITNGCRGKLHQTRIKRDHVVGNFPDRVPNLEDYRNRQTLYNHKQSIRLSTWVITHNLGIIPNIQIFVERPKDVNLNEIDISVIDPNTLIEFTEITPENIDIVDGNTIEVSFLNPEKGVAQCITTNTKSNTVEVVEATLDIVYSLLSIGNEFTIATLDNNINIDIVITFITPENDQIEKYYTVDNLSIKSAWSDIPQAFISGRKYTVRSFDIGFLNGIPNGSSLYLSKMVNGDKISFETNEVLSLLTNSPYEVQDKDVDVLLDLSNITSTKSVTGLIYSKSDIQVDVNKLIYIFPSIIRV